MSNTSHDENGQAFGIFMAKMKESGVLMQRSIAIFNQAEELKNVSMRLFAHAKAACKERIIHPLYKLERIHEAKKTGQDALDKARLAEWTLDQAIEMAEQAHRAWEEHGK